MRVPASTYRLQLHAGFGLGDARAVVPYLARLGVADAYCSPILQARKGSTHGYDVTDPGSINPELGGAEEFDRLAVVLREHRMGLLLDIVPNHMAMSSENPWWMDVLEHGRASRYASFFDIDWHAPELEGKVLVPILGGPYAETLERGELLLRVEAGGPAIRYFDHRFPIDLRSFAPVLAEAADHLERRGDPGARALRRLAGDCERMPPRRLTSPRSVERRARLAASIRRRLGDVGEGSEAVRESVEEAVRRWGGDPDEPGSVERLDQLLAQQPYLLSYWRAAVEEIDYRRFFDISDLVSIRVQEPEVFEGTHRLVLDLAARGAVTGFRIDHIDGLWDPHQYLHRLQGRLGAAGGGGRGSDGGAPGFVVVEKILGEEERLPEDWPVAGTSGYDFLNLVNAMFVDAAGLPRLREQFAKLTGIHDGFPDVVSWEKKKVMEHLFASELGALSARLQHLARRDRHGRDLTQGALREALLEATAALPVYRTYVRGMSVEGADREHVERAVARARESIPPEASQALQFLRRVLLLEPPAKRSWLPFVMRWQQFTGPVMAKGFEDTALYVYNPLISMNDVGGDPGVEPVSVEEFHRRMRERARRWPGALSATSTHDSKRSEDVRTRIDVLSEMPERWVDAVERWREWNRGKRREVDGVEVPDPNEELLLYQTLVGVWPLDRREERDLPGRLEEYMRKAMREAKVHTSWIEPNEAHEEAVLEFVRAVLARSNRRFRADLLSLHEVVAAHGALNSLAQTLLKLTSPGVPDLYQGTELWDLSLVDPDNRRPVDFERRAALLGDIERREGEDLAGLATELLEDWRSGAVKLFVTARVLRFRRDQRDLFAMGRYVPLETAGPRAEHVLAFARRRRGRWALVVVPRLTLRLGAGGAPSLPPDVWGRTAVSLPSGAPGRWVDVLTGEERSARASTGGPQLRVADALARFPVALLAGGQGAGRG